MVLKNNFQRRRTACQIEPVYFSAKSDGFTVLSGYAIQYQSVTTNAGGGMDANSGVFTAPATGAYYFTFSRVANDTDTKVQLKLNGASVGSVLGNKELDVMALVRIINLQKGDTIAYEQWRNV